MKITSKSFRSLWWAAAALSAACNGGTKGDEVLVPDGIPADCEGEAYPPGATEPMTLGETLSPYRWPVAIHRGSLERTALELAAVPCAIAPDIDWSIFDVLLFVSIPAW